MEGASKTHFATIIVSVIVIQDGKLLMMQEAKPGTNLFLCRSRLPSNVNLSLCRVLPKVVYSGFVSARLLASPSFACCLIARFCLPLFITAGRVEVGEDIITAAQRECFEETGLELAVRRLQDFSHLCLNGNGCDRASVLKLSSCRWKECFQFVTLCTGTKIGFGMELAVESLEAN